MVHKLVFVIGVAVLTALISGTAAVAQLTCEVMCAAGTPGTGCPTTPYPTIQSAIDNPLCTSIVLRATQDDFPYREQLFINRSLSIGGKTIKIKGEDPEKIVTTIQPPLDPPLGPGMVGPNLVEISGTPAVRSRVKFRHVIFQGPGPATGGFVGIRANRDTAVTVNHCLFRDIKPPVYDAQWGYHALWLGGPRFPGSKTTTHTVLDSKFYGYQNVGILVEGEGTSLTVGVTTGGSNIISGNSDRDPDMVRRCGDPINTCAERIAQPIGILALDGASPVAKGALVTKLTVSKITIQNNATEDGRGGAFWMHNGPANNVTLNSNAIDDNSLGVGVEKTDGATLVDNHFSGNNYGVVLGWGEASNKNIIQSNRIDNGGVAGLLVGQGTGNKISQNYSTGNSGYGIHLLPTAVNNTLYANRAQNNGLVGFLDESLGTLKGGTANIYTSTSNICDGNNGGAGAVQSSPLDICR